MVIEVCHKLLLMTHLQCIYSQSNKPTKSDAIDIEL